jgi:hypothetical protein
MADEDTLAEDIWAGGGGVKRGAEFVGTAALGCPPGPWARFRDCVEIIERGSTGQPRAAVPTWLALEHGIRGCR